MRHKSLTILPVLFLTLAACGGEEMPDPMSDTAAPSSEVSAPAQESAPIAPITSRGGTPPSGAAAPQGSSGEIDFALPAGWQSETPSNNMRMAQASIPGPGGPGQLAVFYFGPGNGGGAQDNIQRWIGQMEAEAGSQPTIQELQTEHGFKVTWVEMVGTMLPSTMGTGPDTAQPNSRLLGAVVEGPGGPWFFKATGPKDTLAAEREDFLAMIRNARPKG
jgi:hypothetical protein